MEGKDGAWCEGERGRERNMRDGARERKKVSLAYLWQRKRLRFSDSIAVTSNLDCLTKVLRHVDDGGGEEKREGALDELQSFPFEEEVQNVPSEFFVILRSLFGSKGIYFSRS